MYFEAATTGLGYVYETGMKKCVAAAVEASSVTVDTMTGPTVNITAQGIKWHSLWQDCKDVNAHGMPVHQPNESEMTQQ